MPCVVEWSFEWSPEGTVVSLHVLSGSTHSSAVAQQLQCAYPVIFFKLSIITAAPAKKW